MIDQKIFAHQMGILADRIGRALAGPTLREYYDSLSSELTTEQFVAATKLAFNGAKFWLTVDELVALVKVKDSPELVAAEVFERVDQIAGNIYQSRQMRLTAITALHPAAERAFRAAGAFGTFEGLTNDEKTWARKRFIEAFCLVDRALVATEQAIVALKDADARVAALISGVAKDRALPNTPRRIAATSTSPSEEKP